MLQTPRGGGYNPGMNAYARWTLAILGVLAVAGPALGQITTDDGWQAPAVETSIEWFAVLYLLVGVAGNCIVGFKNAKRTHLD